MKKTILSFLIIAAMVTGCQKEKSQPNNNGTGNGTTPNTGTIYFKNTQVDPYKIYVDGYYKLTVSANQTSTGYSVTSGITYSIKAEQASGYAVYPTVYTGTAITNPGGSVTWQF